MVETEKKRGAWLTIWLILMLIANLYSALLYLILNKTLMSVYPHAPLVAWYIYGLLTLANFVFVIFLFMWKRWAFFACCGTTLIAFILNLVIGLGIFSAIFGLVGIVILYLSMKSRWDLFE